MPDTAKTPELVVRWKSPGALLAVLSGDWRTRASLPGIDSVQSNFSGEPNSRSLEFDSAALGTWDSRLVAFLARCHELCNDKKLQFLDAGLPENLRGLLRLADSVPETKDARGHTPPSPALQRIGDAGIHAWNESLSFFTFLGENIQALGKLLRGKAQFRWSDTFLVMQECGPQALGIVALINFLVGLILAFVGATTLQQFGASVYVADMVAIGTVREMGCIMTGIILCGRTGAAFAAQIGTMKVNEEITALQTFGISPVEFLVLPRMIALILMMPLLCVFADLIAISGGYFVSVGMLDVTPAAYLGRTLHAIKLSSFLLGIGKGAFFGFIVAYTGCLRGMQCGSNAAAVGEATTRAVVAGITAIIASDGIFAVICNAVKL